MGDDARFCLDAPINVEPAGQRFQPGTNFEAWTFTILRNNFYSGRRKHREVQDDDGSYAARLTSLPEQGSRLELQDVQGALNQIPEVMREALMLVTVSDLPYEEVVAIMGCQLGTVKSRVWRARSACPGARLHWG